MKSKFLFSILAVVAAVLLPLAAAGQIAPERPPRTEPAEKIPKYEIFAGVGYTSLNNVNQSRNGLLGGNVTVTRDWGKYFGLTADGGIYKYTYDASNPGDPSVDMVLLGPVLHAHIMGKVDGYVHVLLGGEHISGANIVQVNGTTAVTSPFATPKISVAGGYGVGFDYNLKSHFSLRIGGDDILSSFNANGNSQLCMPAGACSTHESRSARAEFGLVYKF
ncbi:MAG: hypothetical protein ABR991_09060 [Terracidiphilus sp.]